MKRSCWEGPGTWARFQFPEGSRGDWARGGRQYDNGGQGAYERPVSCLGGNAQEAVEGAVWSLLKSFVEDAVWSLLESFEATGGP